MTVHPEKLADRPNQFPESFKKASTGAAVSSAEDETVAPLADAGGGDGSKPKSNLSKALQNFKASVAVARSEITRERIDGFFRVEFDQADEIVKRIFFLAYVNCPMGLQERSMRDEPNKPLSLEGYMQKFLPAAAALVKVVMLMEVPSAVVNRGTSGSNGGRPKNGMAIEKDLLGDYYHYVERELLFRGLDKDAEEEQDGGADDGGNGEDDDVNDDISAASSEVSELLQSTQNGNLTNLSDMRCFHCIKHSGGAGGRQGTSEGLVRGCCEGDQPFDGAGDHRWLRSRKPAPQRCSHFQKEQKEEEEQQQPRCQATEALSSVCSRCRLGQKWRQQKRLNNLNATAKTVIANALTI